jgi:hypothetical protein
MPLYAVTIFLSAFLLFQVQPLIAKIILPWFGGSAAVWSASMLFFQLLLLAGYAYAHVSIRFLKPRVQMLVHVALLLASCALLPILPSPAWRPTQVGDPTARILLLLTATIGLPYFLLSSTSPLLQAWFVRRTGSGVPYRLFALSNFGSMLALVSFPFLVEPRLATRQQAFTWSSGYVVFALMCAFTAWVSRGARVDLPGEEAATPDSSERPLHSSERPRVWQLLFWVLLATCASVLLVSVTNHMSQNVAPIPFLWVLPLALYLLTFIFAFESDRIYQRWLFIPLLAPALAGMAYMIYAEDGNFNIKFAIPGFAAGLFICCMFCHGELARRRPAPRHLTLFYLMVSLGGALGGILVALIAPRAFHAYWELPLGLVTCGILALFAVWHLVSRLHSLVPGVILGCVGGTAWYLFKYRRALFTGHPWAIPLWTCGLLILFAAWTWLPQRWAQWSARILVVTGVGVLSWYFVTEERKLAKNLVLQARNFYGPLEVRDDLPTEDYAERTLLHGTINHGSQLLDPVLRYVTTSYYGKRSGVGRAMGALQARGPVRAGIIGLGSGVLSNYGRKGDYFRIYEINPLVERIAQTLFTFYPHSPANKAILMGDARLTLERQLSSEGPQNYDILAVDAFSSDAIPVHLLTREAIQLYFHHLKPNGVLALHISNRYLDLKPVCEGGAASVGRQAWAVEDEGDQASYFSSSTWVLVTSDLSIYKADSFKDAYTYELTPQKGFRPWTDDYSNLFEILNVK